MPPGDGPHENAGAGNMWAATLDPRCAGNQRANINRAFRCAHGTNMAAFQRAVKSRGEWGAKRGLKCQNPRAEIRIDQSLVTSATTISQAPDGDSAAKRTHEGSL